MYSGCSAFIVVLALAHLLALTGCDDRTSTRGSAPPCEPGLRRILRLPLGFEKPGGLVAHIEPGVARVVSVTDGLLLEAAGEAPVMFAWSGPSLGEAFETDEQVHLYQKEQWWVVVGQHSTAAIHAKGGTWYSLVTPPALEGGPSFEVTPRCGWINDDDSSLVTETLLYRLEATLGGESVTIEPGATEAVGEWQVKNVENTSTHALSGNDGSFDPGYWSAISVLGPALAQSDDADAGF